jgi:prepilin-type N-terminal cleavage/methylation domain-containing protein/prepilin-type processing-associated H-X9-DG protein
MLPGSQSAIRPRHRGRTRSGLARAFTLPELAIVLVVIVVLSLLAIPAMARQRARSSRVQCVHNLKNIGLGLRIFPRASNSEFPWQVSTNEWGSKEFLQNPSLTWPHFLALSNELSTPRIARCPNDLTGTQPTTWSEATNNSAFSYFLGVDASEEDPSTILGGDSNLELNGQRLRSTLVTLRTNANVQFDNARHANPPSGAGNILFGDGSVRQMTSADLRAALVLPGTPPPNSIHRWLIP